MSKINELTPKKSGGATAVIVRGSDGMGYWQGHRRGWIDFSFFGGGAMLGGTLSRRPFIILRQDTTGSHEVKIWRYRKKEVQLNYSICRAHNVTDVWQHIFMREHQSFIAS